MKKRLVIATALCVAFYAGMKFEHFLTVDACWMLAEPCRMISSVNVKAIATPPLIKKTKNIHQLSSNYLYQISLT